MRYLYSLLVFFLVCVDVSAQDSPISNVFLNREMIIKAGVKDTINGVAQIVTDFEVKNGVASLVKTKVHRFL
ncbi:hypothetical protein [Bacteroides sedimenti]|uniref:Uncharacterized protein n=1 Tax=Bacteroides sedimenti TaxID=2136147 RepID=A0ABN6Z4H4_9BACE